jgi:hypothetical protein
MKLRSLVVAVALSFAALAASAQTGLYLNPVAMRISNSNADSGLYAFLGQNSTSHMFYGEEFGVYHDFKTSYSFKVGVDVRDSLLTGSGAHLNNFLVGVRFSGHPFHNNWKPYIEPVVGAGTSRAPFTAIHVTKGEYGIYAGLDYETKHHIDLRPIELGYSGLTTASSGTIGQSGPISSSSLLSISAGLIFRFP